jgi:hypothetical protein
MRTLIDLFSEAVESGWMDDLAECWTSFIQAGDVPMPSGERAAIESQLPLQETRDGRLPVHLFPDEMSINGEWFRFFAQRPEVIAAGERWLAKLSGNAAGDA